MQWNPDAEEVRYICELLKNAFNPRATQAEQTAMMQKLKDLSQTPNFVGNMTFILASKDLPHSIRATAALVLKNEFRLAGPSMQPNALQFLHEQLLANLGESDEFLRRTFCQTTVTVFNLVGLVGWPELPAFMLQFLSRQDKRSIDTALYMLKLLIEDSLSHFESYEQSFLDNLFSLLFVHCTSPTNSIRNSSIECISLLILGNALFSSQRLDEFLKILEQLASRSPTSDLLAMICNAHSALITPYSDEMLGIIGPVFEFELSVLSQSNLAEYTRLCACEFWLTICEIGHFYPVLVPLMPSLLPVLLDAMKYDQCEIDDLFGHNNSTKEANDNLYPIHHKQKGEQFEEGEEPDDDDDSLGDDDRYTWNLRKCASNTLDLIAHVFEPDSFIPVLLPLVQHSFNDCSPVRLEVGILAIGAVGEGCYDAIEAHLAVLVPFLINCAAHPKPFVRSISCWTLSRYPRWICQNHQSLSDVIQALLYLIVNDSYLKVLSAAISALGALFDEIGDGLPTLEPFLSHINDAILYSLCHAESRVRVILYGVIAKYCEFLGPSGVAPYGHFVERLFGSYLTLWDKISQVNSPEIYPLLESLLCIILAAPTATLSSVCPVLIQRSLHNCSLVLYPTPGAAVESDPDLALVSLDVIDSLIQVLQDTILTWLNANDLMRVIFDSMSHSYAPLRQSVFGLTGDLVQCTGLFCKLIIPCFVQFQKAVLFNIELITQKTGISNNAIWTMGEMYLTLYDLLPTITDESLSLFLRQNLFDHESLLGKLIDCLVRQHGRCRKSFMQNVAITIGRMALVLPPEPLLLSIEYALPSWIKFMRDVIDQRELESSLTGMLRVMKVNPSILQANWSEFKLLLGSYQNHSTESYRSLIHQYYQLANLH